MSYAFISAEIEEFQQGSWIADLVSAQSFGGSFTLSDGSSWTGTKVSERFDVYRYHTRVIGGANKLTAPLADKFYSGNVSLQTAVSDACGEGGESVGSVAPGVFLNTYQRQAGTLSQVLDQLAAEFSLIWWIDRSGIVNMAAARPSAPDATGTRVSVDSDASLVLIDPVGVVLGASYDSSDSVAAMAAIQHVRWEQNDRVFSAEIYSIPFLFRPPTLTVYEKIYNARVDRDNGNGTIDVIADARFGVKAVPLFSGVPHAKIKVDGGDQVMFGFFGGNPNAPFAVAMAQDPTATKQVARVQDNVSVTFTTADAALIIAPAGAGGGPCSGGGFTLTGTIQSGTSRIAIGD